MLNSLIAILFLFIIPADSADSEINNFFKEVLKNYDEYKIEKINFPENISSVKFLSNQVDEKKNIISLPVEAKLKNGDKVKTYLSFRLQLFRKALHANSIIQKETELKPEFFTYKKIEVNSIKGTPIFSFEEISNTRNKRKINPDEILIEEFIEKIPVITSGDPVNASVISGNIIITVDAFSKQDGIENDIIRIVTKDKKLFKAKIVDSQNVTIIE